MKKLCSKYLENSQIVVYLILILLLVLAQNIISGIFESHPYGRYFKTCVLYGDRSDRTEPYDPYRRY
ncbi:MAG: hypothetical protein ACLVAV_10405 [Clostridium sp.]